MASKSISLFVEISATKQSIAQRKLIFGVGVNDAKYMTNPTIDGRKLMCSYYSVWMDMIKRCYSEKVQSKQPAYIGCSVAEEWHSFSAFKEWMSHFDWKGKYLDKDLLIVGNKIYSPETCIFVSRSINNLLTHIKSTKGAYPTGVSFHSNYKNKFQAECKINGKTKYLGLFPTPEEAGKVYRIAKAEEVNRVALLQEDVRVRDGLIKHAENILNE